MKRQLILLLKKEVKGGYETKDESIMLKNSDISSCFRLFCFGECREENILTF